MFNWVPLPYYGRLFYYIMLALTALIGAYSLSFNLKDKQRLSELNYLGYVLVLFITLYIGLRPINGRYFGDMGNYFYNYRQYQAGIAPRLGGDALFNYLMWLCAQYLPAKYFFFLVGLFYVLPMYVFSRKHFRKYWFFSFFMFLASFSFWSYGTNGLRNGLGTSLFIWGLSYYHHQKRWMYLLFALSFFIHASLIIPIIAFLITRFLIKNPRWILGGWLLSIPLSLIGGAFWGEFFESLGLLEDRAEGYLTGGQEYLDMFSKTGFRWDFLLYSSFAIFAGWYFIFKKKIKDKFYIHLFGTYAIANAFWILVIDSTFSNRFAYLSWFLMAPVIIYPLCKYEVVKRQYRLLGGIILLYFSFTYILFLLE